MDKLTKHILISAGELSGDMHAANLVQEVIRIAPQTKFYGMGAKLMQKVGVNLIVDARDLSIIGGLDIIIKLRKICQAFFTMKKFIWRKKPDLLILVDYPGFNLRLAKVAKKAGIKVLYFISPKIWAWHQSRIETIKKNVDMMAVIFPFEVDLYKKWGVPVTFVGNPLLKLVPPKPSLLTMQKFFNLKPGGKTIALFPGSRISEIKRLLPVMLDAAQIIKSHYPNTQFLLSQASSITLDDLKTYLKQNPIEIQIITGQNYNIMAASDAIITASGTATLEIALVETPMVIIYRMSWLEAQIAKRLIKIPFVGLCNILLNKKITLELLQDDVTPEKIAAEIEKILIDDRYRQEMINNLKTIRTILDDGEKMDIGKLVVTMIG